MFSRKIDRKNIHTTLFPTIEEITRETTARTFSKHPVVRWEFFNQFYMILEQEDWRYMCNSLWFDKILGHFTRYRTKNSICEVEILTRFGMSLRVKKLSDILILTNNLKYNRYYKHIPKRHFPISERNDHSKSRKINNFIILVKIIENFPNILSQDENFSVVSFTGF